MAGLNEQDLDGIVIRQMAASEDRLYPIALRLITEDVPALVAEVRRLREALKRIASDSEQHYRPYRPYEVGGCMDIAMQALEPATERDSEA